MALTLKERANVHNARRGEIASAAGRPVTLQEVVEANTPGHRATLTTTSSSYSNVTAFTIPTSTDKLYSVGVRWSGYEATGGLFFAKESTFTYKNDAGTLAQFGSDSDIISQDEDGSWGGDHTTSGTSILVRVTGDATNDVAWTVDVWYSEITPGS